MQTQKTEIVKIVRQSIKAYLCECSEGKRGWINKEKFPEDGILDSKLWNKKVLWAVKNRKGE